MRKKLIHRKSIQFQLILKCFEFRVPARDELGRVGSGLKYCKLNSAVHNSQLVTRNTQRKNEPSYLRRRNRSMDRRILSCIREIASASSPISSLDLVSISIPRSPMLIRSATSVKDLILPVSRWP